MTRTALMLRYIAMPVLLLTGLSACHRVSTERDDGMFDAWPNDTLKYMLGTHDLTDREEMIATGRIGMNYTAAGQIDSARLYLNRALEMPGGREYNGGRFLANFANLYAASGEYTEALKYYIEILDENSEWVPERGKLGAQGLNVIRALAGATKMYYMVGNIDEALHYAQRAEAIDEIYGWNYITPQYTYIIGLIHLDKGELDSAQIVLQRMLEKSEEYTQYAIDVSGSDLGMYSHVSKGHEGLARVALARGEFAAALEHAREALDYAERGDKNPALIAQIFHLFSNIHMAQGNYPESGAFARQALETSPDYPIRDPDVLFNSGIARLHGGELAAAHEDLSRYAELMRANTDKQFRETMASMEVAYETEKRERHIADLERQRMLYIAIGIVGFLLAGLISMFMRQKIKNERREKQLVAANAVLEWEKKERKRFAGDLHDGINGMLAAIKFELGVGEDLQNIRDRLDECIEAIRAMSRSRMPTSLQRYGLKASLEDYCRLFPNVDFHFYGRDGRMDEKVELTVYFCAYELVNNASKHSGAKKINVQLVQDDEAVSLTVQDDGCGFDEDRVANGGGLKSIRDRVASLDGRIDIVSSVGTGTEINIELRENRD